jgi:hypothetical protein
VVREPAYVYGRPYYYPECRRRYYNEGWRHEERERDRDRDREWRHHDRW